MKFWSATAIYLSIVGILRAQQPDAAHAASQTNITGKEPCSRPGSSCRERGVQMVYRKESLGNTAQRREWQISTFEEP